MRVVLLSGGSGQRLWPLSNDSYSKQYIKVVQHDAETTEKNQERCSMLQRVYAQLEAVGLEKELVIAANEAQKEVLASQLPGKVINIAVEPSRRDTFPAVVLSCAYLSTKCNITDDEVIMVLPVDPYVTLDYFRQLKRLAEMLKTKENTIGLLGAVPTYPSAKYGYILGDNETEDYIAVSGFEEKPIEERAEELIAAGALWNCGVFCFKLGIARQWLEKYHLPLDYNELFVRYEKLPKISFDYEVLEHWRSVIAMPYRGMWKDIGTWNTLTEEMQESFVGKGIMDNTSKACHVVNTLDIPVVLMGGNNLIVSASHDGILVAEKQESSYLKECLSKIEVQPRYEERHWGTIKTLDWSNSKEYSICTNKIKVLEGQSTTYHCHRKHEELLTILSGEGRLKKTDVEIVLLPGMTMSIMRNEYHSIHATKELKYIEVLMGDLSEDDVECEDE